MSRVALVIDDLPFYRQRMRNLLRQLGYLVYEAGSGEEGVEIARRVHPGLVLLDQVMPGWSGLETFDRIRQEGLDGTVVVLSPRLDADDAKALRDAGVAAVLSKSAPSPVMEAELRRILETAAAA